MSQNINLFDPDFTVNYKKDIYRHLVLIIDLKLVMYVVQTVSVTLTKLAFFFHLVQVWPLSTHLHTHANIHTPSE